MEIVKDDQTFFGCVEIDGKICCGNCKTVEPEFKPTVHMDAPEYFINNGNCLNCGHELGVKTMRDEESLAYWSDCEA